MNQKEIDAELMAMIDQFAGTKFDYDPSIEEAGIEAGVAELAYASGLNPDKAVGSTPTTRTSSLSADDSKTWEIPDDDDQGSDTRSIT